jgi:hypothetical protein
VLDRRLDWVSELTGLKRDIGRLGLQRFDFERWVRRQAGAQKSFELIDSSYEFRSQLLGFVCALLEVESRLLFLVVRPLTGGVFLATLPLTLKRTGRTLSLAPTALGFSLHLYPNATACHGVDDPTGRNLTHLRAGGA